MTHLSEPGLWTIVISLSGIVVAGGRYILGKLAECEKDREDLIEDVFTIATAHSAVTGEPLSLRTLKR